MRKGYFLLIIVFALFGAMFALSACGHECYSTATEYTVSATEHYKTCDKCGKKIEAAEHTGDTWLSDESGHYKVCTVCNGQFSEGEHDLGPWTSDGTNHWQPCSICSAKVGLATHRLGNWQTDSTNKFHYRICEDCLVRVDEKEHTAKTWESDGENHWQVCTKCNLKFNESAHELEWQTNIDSHWRTCTICEKVTDEGEHDKTEQFESDGVSHWKSCTICKQRLEEQNHDADDWNRDDQNHSQICKICNAKYNEGKHSALLYRADKDKHWQICESCGFKYNENTHGSIELCRTCNQDFVGTEGLLYTEIKDEAGNILGYSVGAGELAANVTEVSIPLYHDGQPVLCVGMTLAEYEEMYNTGSHYEDEVQLFTQQHCFTDFQFLTDIRLPALLTDIGVYAFSGTLMKTIEIPDTVKTIEGFAFMGCKSLEEVHLPTELETIKDYAFQFTSAWNKDIVLPNSVKDIGISSFEASGITGIVIGKNVKLIPDHTFYACASLKQVTFSDSVQEIGLEAFRQCYALENVKFGAGIETLYSRAFIYCANLTSITIPKSVKRIEDIAFFGCEKLKSVIFEDPNGWNAGADKLNEKDLAKPAVAAKYLTMTYSQEGTHWTKEK